MKASDLLTQHFTRLKADQKAALERLGIISIRDLLYHFPARYEAAGPTGTISSALSNSGTDVTLYGTIRTPEMRKAWKSKRPIAEAWLEDASGKIKLMWFNQPYIAKMLTDGMVVRATGRMAGIASKAYLANPEIDRSPIPPEDVHESLFTIQTDDEDGKNVENVETKKSGSGSAKAFAEQTLYAIYPESKGISSLWFLHALKRIFEARVHETIEDPIPSDILERYNLPSLATALVWMHAPKTKDNADAARKRFAFEEVFMLQLSLAEARRKAAREKALPVTVDRAALADFVKSFPFPPTDAQKKAIDEVITDFEKVHPMRRLLEGDVGSGKTAVAAATAYLVATSRPPAGMIGENGTAKWKHDASGKAVLRQGGTLQVAYMCPTEILAKQHFATFVSYFKDHPIQIGLITGSECRKFPSKINRELSTKISRAQFRKWVANGEIPIVIGTHALIQKSLEFKTLAYAIIDEQHRFGKVARHTLAQKSGLAPHLLSMTATPIPRTLALTIYGDLDLSLLDQMPVGRKPIITEILGPEKRELAYARVREELKAGRQAYIICPRIDEPDPTKEMAIIAKSVKAEATRLKNEVFQDASIGILHSKMTPLEKEESMRAFEKGETQILVATSVVEVGVNVPNATVILIEGAERFGLSQLHQLRGRVIRSNNQAYCFVLPEKLGDATKDRLKALATAKNGFELAEADLLNRGAGQFYGSRQWGISDITMEAIKNLKLVEAARTESARLVQEDPTLDAHPLLKHLLASKTEKIHIE